jgi:hypothetical protein
MENGVMNEDKKEKSQGIEGSANANDVWVWMMPHIEFCTIGNCDLYFFLLIESLPAACKFHPFFKYGAFQLRFHLFFFPILSPLSLFFEDPTFAGRDFTH